MKFKVQNSKLKVLTVCVLSMISGALTASSISTNKTFMLETNNVLPPSETNFFEVNLGLLEDAVTPGGGALGSEDWIVSQLASPGIYVDSVLGNDANPGTEAAPLQHLHAVTALLGANLTVATNIYLKRGSKFYESFIVPTNAFVGDWSVGVKPVITGVTNLANVSFTLTTGKTNTYQMPLVVPIETNLFAGNIVQSNVLMVWQANQRMGARWDQNVSYNNNTNTAINSVDGNPNSFFYDLTNHVLYLNTSSNGNPATNGLVYEASIRTLALVGSSNCTVSNIIGEKCYAHDNGGNEGYGILGQYSGMFINCVGRHSWNHCVGFAPPLGQVGTNVFISCYGWDVESNITYTASGSVFVADASSASNNTTANPACGIFSNCLAVATPQGLASADTGEYTYGFFSHELTNLTVQIYGCAASNCYYGFGGGQTNITVLTNCVAVSCYNGVQTVDSADIVDHFFAYNCTNGVLGQTSTTNLIVNNSQFWQMNSAGVWGRAATNMYLTNDIFASTNTQGTGIETSYGTVPIRSYSNSFWQLSQAYSGGIFTNLSGANTADYNDYYGNTKVAGNQIPAPDYATTFANWQSMWPLADTHGITGNPNYPANNFAYGATPPTSDTNSGVGVPLWIAVQNGGGLTNLQGNALVGNLVAPSNLYVVKTNFANYEWVTNLFKGIGGGVLTGNFNDALDLYADSGGDDISIFHANNGNSVVFDQNADITLFGGLYTGNGSGLNNLNAANLASGAVPYAVLPSQVITNGYSAPLTNIIGGVTNITSPSGTTNWASTYTNMTGYWNGLPWMTNITATALSINYTITNELQPGSSIWMVFSNSPTYGYPWLSAYSACSIALVANATAVCPTNAGQATAFWLGNPSSGIFRHWEQNGSGTTASLGGTDATTTSASGSVGSFSSYQGTQTGSIYYTPSSTNLMDLTVTVTATFSR